MKNLVIVESPAKAKTIGKYLGSDFTVLSSIGHIRNIAKKAVKGHPPIDTEHNYETIYEIDNDKKKTIADLKKAVKDASTVWLATDEDREGEAIAWHLCEVLKLDPTKTNRIAFHEITKPAIEGAIKHPRTVDMDLVHAQQARQILDRLVGFELSPVVWRKVPGGKSAGRVQSPAVRLLVEREREIEKFQGSSEFKITANFIYDKNIIKAELKNRFSTEQEANDFLETLIGAKFKITDATTAPATHNPSAPFTTSTLQQEANSRLNFSAKATMASAQKLYQAGKITYMRTDSVNLSKQAIGAMAHYIEDNFGKKYSQIRTYKTKSANAQEAHEAIRPTDIATEKASSSEYDQKLYDLIRRRTLASQMAAAELERTTITIENSKNKYIFEAKGEVIIFDGFLKVYKNKKDDIELPKAKVNDPLSLENAEARQVFARPPARYTEGGLVKKLEALGIGRPSTYATIINTIQARDYAEKGEGEGKLRQVIELDFDGHDITRHLEDEKTGADKGKLVPTPIGEVMSDFLVNHFDQIVDYKFTANVEKEFDQISNGKLDRNKMLDKFYIPFHKLIESSDGIDRSSVAKSREIGTDPKTGKVILARFGRYGPLLQLGEGGDKEDKPKFAPMPKDKKIETVTLADALKAFILPRIVGQTENGDDMKVNIGRFGPYIQVGKLFISIKPPLDPYNITHTEALELYKAKLKAEAEKTIAQFDNGIQVLRGRFGPYVTDGTKNVKIPKDIDPTSVTADQAAKLIETAPEKKQRKKVIKKAKKS